MRKAIEVDLKKSVETIWADEDGNFFNGPGPDALHYKLAKKKNGYLTLRISRCANRQKYGRNFYAHRLIAQAFIGDVSGKVVNHLNSQRDDNRVANLEIIKAKLNTRHAQLNNSFSRHATYGEFLTVLGMHYEFKVSITRILEITGFDRQWVQSWLSGGHALFTERYKSEGNVFNILEFKNLGSDLPKEQLR